MATEQGREEAGNLGDEPGTLPSSRAASSSRSPASWKRVFLPPLLVPLSWVLIALLNPRGFPAELFYLYLLIALVCLVALIIRLLVALVRLRWDRLALRPLLVIGWVVAGMALLGEGVAAINADMEQLAQSLQEQCRSNGRCPTWPIELPVDCRVTEGQHFYCVRNHISFRCHLSQSNDGRVFYLFDGYGIFLGNQWSGGVEVDLERRPWD